MYFRERWAILDNLIEDCVPKKPGPRKTIQDDYVGRWLRSKVKISSYASKHPAMYLSLANNWRADCMSRALERKPCHYRTSSWGKDLHRYMAVWSSPGPTQSWQGDSPEGPCHFHCFSGPFERFQSVLPHPCHTIQAHHIYQSSKAIFSNNIVSEKKTTSQIRMLGIL